jgi:hypothetical protein
MISYVITTRDRPAELAWTLEAIYRLGDHAEVGGAEVIVADHASAQPVTIGPALPSGVPVKVIRDTGPSPAAACNAAARAADPRSDWLVLLHDDAHPLHEGLFAALREAHDEAGAIAAEVFRPAPDDAPRHDSGGLPEVFASCAGAVRRDLFLAVGGYDAAMERGGEAADLCARIILAGRRVQLDRRFAVMHRRAGGTDVVADIRRLVRNTVWTIQRYAPADQIDWHVEHALTSLRTTAAHEHAMVGYDQAITDLMVSRARQVRRPLPRAWWDRFTGLHHARRAMEAAQQHGFIDRACFVHPGPGAWAVRQAAFEVGIAECVPSERPDAHIVATLEPGPMLDAMEVPSAPPTRMVAPWLDVLTQSDSARA